MTLKAMCECGLTAVDDYAQLHAFGAAEKRHYCDKCLDNVKAYEAAVTELQEKLTKDWTEGVAKLRKKHGKLEAKEGQLPAL